MFEINLITSKAMENSGNRGGRQGNGNGLYPTNYNQLPVDQSGMFMNANPGVVAYTPSNNDMSCSRSNFTSTPIHAGSTPMRR
jgi:hypothetical protein